MMLQVMQHGNAANTLANSTVQSIINAYNREPLTRLETAQASTAESLYPGATEAQSQNTERVRLTNALLRASNPIAISKAQLDLDNERALGTLPKQIVEAQLKKLQDSGKASIDIPLTDASGNPVIGADGKQTVLPGVTSDAIYKTLYGKEPGGLTQQNVITNQRNTRLDAEKLAAQATKDEEVILGTKVNPAGVAIGKNVDDPAIQPTLESFNSKSNGPHAWVWAGGEVIPSTGFGVVNPFSTNTIPEKAYKVVLPRDKDGQLTARMAHNDATKLHMTMKEYLEALHKKGRIKGKLPWQR